jgi:hypothetical protein
MSESSHVWAAPRSEGGAAMLSKSTLSPEITPELDEAFDTFAERLEWMLAQGWEGQWVAISGADIVDHDKPKRELAKLYEDLYQEKKLLLKRVFRDDVEHDYSIV